MRRSLPRDRLQPSLLDRLRDDDPKQTTESPEQRVLSMRALRSHVIRDLQWLFNTGKLEAIEDLSRHPHVAKSVLNYGLRDLAGRTLSNTRGEHLEEAVREAVTLYEPRILPESIRERTYIDEERMAHNTVAFEIEGELWAEPAPEHVYLRTQIDLEDGSATVTPDTGEKAD